MIDFEPSEEQRLMVDEVSALATQLRARARETEKARGLAPDLLKTAHEMGLGGGVAVPESHGGAGLGLVTAVLIDEALAYGDPAAPLALGGPGSLGLALAELASADVARATLERLAKPGARGAVAWSEARPAKDRAGFETTATRDGQRWILRGHKSFVLGAEGAELLLVFAQVDEAAGWDGFGAFLVEASAPGVSVRARKTTLGLDAVSACDVAFEDVKLDDGARLTPAGPIGRAALRFFVKAGLLGAARAVGLSQAAFDTALDYVVNRKAFGKPIGHFQAVAFTLADRAMELDAARAMVWRAAALWDQLASSPSEALEREALVHSGWAVSYALEGAMKAGDTAVQLHGGAGFMRDYIVEKLMRDAKQLGLCFLTAEQADQIAAAVELGAPLDPALVLPTPDLQAVFT